MFLVSWIGTISGALQRKLNGIGITNLITKRIAEKLLNKFDKGSSEWPGKAGFSLVLPVVKY